MTGRDLSPAPFANITYRLSQKKLTDVLDCLEDIFTELWTEMQTEFLGMCSDWDHLTNLPQ